MWDLFAIIAAVLFLLDVAVRRIAIDWQGARSEVSAAMQVRQAGDGTVAAWKKARQSRGAREAAPEQTAAMRRTLEEGPALDVRAEAKDGGAAAEAAAKRAQQQAKRGGAAGDTPGAGADAEPQDTTSRLLRAKRRATGDDGSANGEGGADRGGPRA
jgi:hypothetical protein